MNPAGTEEWERFRSIRLLHNHWARPIGPRAYYWYLTFENYPELHSIAKECQQEIAFPYYDMTPPRELHLTLDRIALERDIEPDQLAEIEHAAARACSEIPPFEITLGYLGGTRGAIGFSAYPEQPIRELRDTLRAVTLSSRPNAPAGDSEFHPHVTIAYANSDNIQAAEVIAAVEKLNATASATVTVTHGTLVLLERRPRSYAWQAFSRIPLSGYSTRLRRRKGYQRSGRRKPRLRRGSRTVRDRHHGSPGSSSASSSRGATRRPRSARWPGAAPIRPGAPVGDAGRTPAAPARARMATRVCIRLVHRVRRGGQVRR